MMVLKWAGSFKMVFNICTYTFTPPRTLKVVCLNPTQGSNENELPWDLVWVVLLCT